MFIAVSMRAACILLLFAACASACVDKYELPPPRFPNGQPGPGSPALHSEALRELQAARATAYAHAFRIDEDRGVFEYDCSGFADYAISNVAPDALEALRAVRGTDRPNARVYVQLLAAIAPGQTRERWQRIASARELLPGDIIAWLLLEKKKDYLGTVNTGHVMIVDEAPHERVPGEWIVPIIDASGGHGGADGRHMPDATGLGRGTVVVVTENDVPVGYRWTESARAGVIRTRVMLGRIL